MLSPPMPPGPLTARPPSPLSGWPASLGQPLLYIGVGEERGGEPREGGRRRRAETLAGAGAKVEVSWEWA